ncbi:hypothetical protein VPH35_104477 [Triticum aestivum]
MSTSEVSESADSMDEDMSQVPRVRSSKVWEHYEQDLVRIHGDLKAVCKYCGTQLHTKFGTMSLRTHIVESCKSIEDGCRENFLLTMKKTTSEGPFVFDQKVCRDLLSSFASMLRSPFLSLNIHTFSHGLTQCSHHFKSWVITQFAMMQ